MKVARREFLGTVGGLAFAQQQAARKPNMVFLLADDLGFRDLGYQGGPMATPHLDRLAREGRVLPRHYTYPLCSPTRSGIMTGRNPMRLGLGYTVVRPWERRGLPLDETTMPEVFRAAGYRTGMVGKWHLGHWSKAQTPNGRGFDHFYGHVNGAIDYFTHERDGGLDWQRNGKSLREEGYTTDLIAAEAVRWMGEGDAAKPFFLYVPFNSPHSPLQAPERLRGRHADIGDERRRTFVQMVEAMDEAVGKIVAQLQKSGQMENTLIAFQSDNGGPRGQGANNGTLRAGKATVYEGGLRVPAFVHWKGKLEAGEAQGVTTLCDWLPTLVGAAGIPLRAGKPLDGMNVWPQLLANNALPGRKDLYFAVEPGTQGVQMALIDGQYKLVRVGAREELFDVEADPSEKKDVRSFLPEVATRMSNRLDAWMRLAPKNALRHSGGAPKGFVAPKEWAELAR